MKNEKLTLWEEIKEEEKEVKEPIEFIIIREFDGFDKEKHRIDKDKIEVSLSFEESKKYLNYTYNRGHNTPNHHYFIAYTKNWILFPIQIDDAPYIKKIPRNPINYIPNISVGD